MAAIQPRGLVLSVHKKTVNTVDLGIETNATLPPTTVLPTPPLIRGKGAKIGSKFDRAELPLPIEVDEQKGKEGKRKRRQWRKITKKKIDWI